MRLFQRRGFLLVFLLALTAWAVPNAATAAETQYVTPNLLSYGNGGFTGRDDRISTGLPIGFTFTFGGVDYTQAVISINGVLFFSNPATDYYNYDLSSVWQGASGVFALWDDLYLGPAGGDEGLSRILYSTEGEPGSRIFIAQWTNIYSYGETLEVGTFNVVLYEGSNKIDIYYRNMLGASTYRSYGREATIGIRTSSGYVNQYSNYSPLATEGRLLTYTPGEGGASPYTHTVRDVTPATAAAIPTYYLSYTSSPKVPVNLSASPSTPNLTSATLSWDLSALGVAPTHFRIRYADNADFNDVAQTADIAAGSLPYVLTNLTPGETYYWQVVAYGGGTSSNSPVSQFTQVANNAPVAEDGSFTVAKGGVYNGTLSASDADNTPATSGLIYSITTAAANGTAAIADSATGGFSYTPAADFSGSDSFGFKAFDGTAYSNEGIVTVTVKPGSAGPITYTLAYIKGQPVPGAGADARIQAGAVWFHLGLPAINDAETLAFIGKWKAPKGEAQSSQYGVGIFVNDTLVAKSGDPVPGAGVGDLPGDATFRNFRAPVIDQVGHVAFLATIKGRGVNSFNDSVVVSSGRTGDLEVIARKGWIAPGTGGATYRYFSAVSIQGQSVGGTLFTATLLAGSGTPAVTPASDKGAWWLPSGETSVLKLVREGDPGFVSGETIRSFQLLRTVGGSPAHGRGQIAGNKALLQLALSGGSAARQVQALAQPGSLTDYAASDDVLGGSILPEATWRSMSLPSFGNLGANLSVYGSLTANTGGVGRVGGTGIFVSADSGATWDPLVRVGDAAPGLNEGATYLSMRNPVNSSTGEGVAVLAATLGGGVTTADNDGIWWKPASDSLMLVAREGAQPPGAPENAKWLWFQSLALPGGDIGPVFTATLAKGPGGITGADDFGLYGVDSVQAVRELLRENQPLLDRTVKKFNTLQSTPGTAGVGRSFNANGQVAAVVNFTNRTSAIVKIQVP